MSLTAATPPTMRECIYMSLWMTVCGFVYLYECHKSCVGVWMCMRQIASWGGGRWVGQGATREPTQRHTQKNGIIIADIRKKQTQTIHGYYLDNKVTFTHWVLLCLGFFCPLLKGFCCYCFKLQQGGEERGTKEVVKHLFCLFGTPIDIKWAETGSWWRAFPLPSLSTCLNTLPHWAVGRGRRRRWRCWATSSLDMYLI